MNALCPNCAECEGEQTDRSRSEDGHLVTFTCPGCDHEWNVPL